MKRLELSVAADAELFDILAYGTAVHGEAASDAYYLGLTDVFDFLCGNPALDMLIKVTKALGVRLAVAA